MVKLREVRLPPPRDAGGGASPEARPESSYRFKPKFILVVAKEEFICYHCTNPYRYGMNLPEVLAGDMNEVYQTVHIDDGVSKWTKHPHAPGNESELREPYMFPNESSYLIRYSSWIHGRT